MYGFPTCAKATSTTLSISELYDCFSVLAGVEFPELLLAFGCSAAGLVAERYDLITYPVFPLNVNSTHSPLSIPVTFSPFDKIPSLDDVADWSDLTFKFSVA
jgi:hypothetical protein